MASVLRYDDYTIAWIAVLHVEAQAAINALDRQHDGQFPSDRGDDYLYIAGEAHGHNIVIATLPEGENYGVGTAAAVASSIKSRFRNLWFALLVGVAAGLPNYTSNDPSRQKDIRLGDVLVAVPDKESSGVVQYDFGRDTEDGFQTHGRQAEVPALVRSAISRLRLTRKRPFKQGGAIADQLERFLRHDEDHVFSCPSSSTDCLFATPTGSGTQSKLIPREARDVSELSKVWYGRIGSGNSLMRNPHRRDALRDEFDLIGLEMEAAGVMNVLPTGIIRGVCDYGDEHKNKLWQPYAAAVAAVYAKAILSMIVPRGKLPVTHAPFATDELTTNNQGKAGVSSSVFSIQERMFVPFRRDKDFVDRPEILDRIDRICSEPAGRVALLGLGGVGKSQLAIEYAFRVHERHPRRWIFWMHASTVSRLEQEYRNMAETLQLAGRDDQHSDVQKMVNHWLCNKENGEWLVIIDNADDVTVFQPKENGLEKSSRIPVGMTLPQSSHGSVLVTTRSRSSAVELVGRSRDIVRVEPMGEELAVELLGTKLDAELDSKQDLEDARQLVQSLDRLPLAIGQAAAYINRLGPRSSVSEYLSNFQMNERNKVNLLSSAISDLRRDQSASNSILYTWQISFEHIRATRPSAANLLSLVSCCDRQGIPAFMLLEYLKHESQYTTWCRRNDTISEEKYEKIMEPIPADHEIYIIRDIFDSRLLDEDLATLSDYSLITIDGDGGLLHMHRLVQLATRTWLKLHDELTKWQEAMIFALYISLPLAAPNNWARCRILLPHIEIVRQQTPGSRVSALRLSSILREISLYLVVSGSYTTGMLMQTDAVHLEDDILGRRDSKAVESLENLGNLRIKLNVYTISNCIFQFLLDEAKQILGDEHWLTIRVMLKVAHSIRQDHRWDEAERLYNCIVQWSEHHDYNCEPEACEDFLQILIKPEALTTMVLDRCRDKLGPTHQDTLITMSDLGLFLASSERLEEAVALQRDTIKLLQQHLSLTEIVTLACMANLACNLCKLGGSSWHEAIAIYRELLPLLEDCDYEINARENTLLNYTNLAIALRATGQLDEAEKMARESVEAHMEAYGDRVPSTVYAMGVLAGVLSDKGHLDEAETIIRRLLELNMQMMGDTHDMAVQDADLLASILARKNQFEDAKDLIYQLYLKMATKYGENDPGTAKWLDLYNHVALTHESAASESDEVDSEDSLDKNGWLRVEEKDDSDEYDSDDSAEHDGDNGVRI